MDAEVPTDVVVLAAAKVGGIQPTTISGRFPTGESQDPDQCDRGGLG